MQQEPVIVFRDVPSSPVIEDDILVHIERLEKRYGRLVGCRVVVDAPHQHHQTGKLYHVRVDLALPGHDIEVNREPGLDHGHEDVFVAIRDAFDAAERQLQAHAEKQRGDVKHHEEQPVGRIAKLFPWEGYGFIETGDGEEVYFHKNAVVDATFGDLTIGDEVRFAPEDGEDGLQATSVHVVHRRK